MAHIIAGRPLVASDNETLLRNEFMTESLGESGSPVNSLRFAFAHIDLLITTGNEIEV
jgi:hypothetical protein